MEAANVIPLKRDSLLRNTAPGKSHLLPKVQKWFDDEIHICQQCNTVCIDLERRRLPKLSAIDTMRLKNTSFDDLLGSSQLARLVEYSCQDRYIKEYTPFRFSEFGHANYTCEPSIFKEIGVCRHNACLDCLKSSKFQGCRICMTHGSVSEHDRQEMYEYYRKIKEFIKELKI